MVSEKGDNGVMSPEQLAKRMGFPYAWSGKVLHQHLDASTAYPAHRRFSESHYQPILELSEQRPVTQISEDDHSHYGCGTGRVAR
jgi:hypothetical protein